MSGAARPPAAKTLQDEERARQKERCRKSLQNALDCNLGLQQEIRRQLVLLQEAKRKNRVQAVRCLEFLQKEEDTSYQLLPPGPEPSAEKVQEITKISRVISKRRKQFQYKPDRKWPLDYFVDPLGLRPEPNQDTIKRRKIEESTFFYHRSPPWTKGEDKLLKAGEREPEKLAEATKKEKGFPSTSRSRTTLECKLRAESLNRKRPFSKEESQLIQSIIKQSEGKPDWHKVAEQLSDRTAWECMCHYKQKLEKVPLLFDPTHDAVLLRYMACQGPQFVWDNAAAAHWAHRMAPSLPLSRVFQKTGQINPNITTEFWKADPERKFLLAMHMYDNNLPKVTNHFPDRTPMQVHHKWERSMLARMKEDPKWGKKRKRNDAEEEE